MVTLSELKQICAESEAALTDEERAERDRRHRETLAGIARHQERLLAPALAMERALAPVRIMEVQLAPMRALQDTLSLAENPAMRLAHELAESPTVKLVREIAEGPLTRLAQECARSFPAPEVLDFAGIDRLGALTRHLEGMENRRSSLDPTFLLPPKPRRDTDQDERFENLSAVVVAQTEEIVELRREVQRVRESAAADAEHERQAATVRERKKALMQWVLVAVAAILSALAARLLS
jgi:hypothetical protein